MRGQALNVLLLVGLLAVGGFGWRLAWGPELAVDTSPLAALPQEIDGWQSLEAPLDSAVEAELRADLNLQRTYHGPGIAPVWLYIGYYGTSRGGRPEHVPRGCYPGAGWSIEESRVVTPDPETHLRANEYRLEREGEQRLVHFWYRSHRQTGMLGGLDLNLDRILGRLGNGRSDGALVRVSTPVLEDGEVAARGRLMAFSSKLDPLLVAHWPLEYAAH